MKNIKVLLIFLLIISCTATTEVVTELTTTSTYSSTTTSSTTTTIPEDLLIVKTFEELPNALVRIQVKSTKAELTEDLEIEIFEYEGSGSGFFISSDGYIVTNNHVISGAVTIEVFTQYRSQPYTAKLIGLSECDDLAVIKIDISDSQYLVFENSEPKLGQDILAAGFPLGDEEVTFLNGIVSKKQTNGSTSWASIEYAFEHTAEILPGSSGGPIVNDDVKVLGIAYAGNEDRQEFGIPIVVVEKKITQIINDEFQYSFKANVEQFYGGGLYVYSVDSDSPFREVGIKGGELITEIKGLSLAEETTLKVYCDALFARDPDIGIKFAGVSLENLEEFEVEVSLDGKVATTNSRTSIISDNSTKQNNSNKEVANPTSEIDKNLTFNNTPPLTNFELIGNKISDTEAPIIKYSLAPYIDQTNFEWFEFIFEQFGRVHSVDAYFSLIDTDLDGITDKVMAGPPWHYDYWLDIFGARDEALTIWYQSFNIKEDYYFMLNQDLLKTYINFGKPQIMFCMAEYKIDRLKAAGPGKNDHILNGYPEDCPFGHFFIRFNKTNNPLWNRSYDENYININTYPTVFNYKNNYSQRIFGP